MASTTTRWFRNSLISGVIILAFMVNTSETKRRNRKDDTPCPNLIKECPCGKTTDSLIQINVTQCKVKGRCGPCDEGPITCSRFLKCKACNSVSCERCHFGETGSYCEEKCGHSSAETPIIFGGQNAGRGQWPFMALVITFRLTRVFRCGGSIIHKAFLILDWVLTAAHCLCGGGSNVPLNVDSITVATAVHEFTKWRDDGHVLKVGELIVHPDYSRSPDYDFDADVALILLKDSIIYSRLAQPICLPEQWSPALPAGTRLHDSNSRLVRRASDRRLRGVNSQSKLAVFYRKHDHYAVTRPLSRLSEARRTKLAGWGGIGNSQSADILQFAPIQVLHKKLCIQYFGPIVTCNMLCGTYLNHTGVACPGESGGPLMRQAVINGGGRNHRRWVQRGIVSFGNGACATNGTAVYSRIETFIYWIRQKTGLPFL